MASTKEALALVLDVGPQMSQGAPGDHTPLKAAITAINMILQRKMFSESKDEVTLVLFGTNTTANELAEGSSQNYQHISVARPLGPVNWPLMQFVQNDIEPGAESADFLDAMIVAMDVIIKGVQGKRGFASRRLILFSNVGAEFGDDQLEAIIGGMKAEQIEFNVIGPDLDRPQDDDGGEGTSGGAGPPDQKPLTSQQNLGHQMLSYILEQMNGEWYSFDEALPALSFFQARSVRPTPWKCPLEVGPGVSIPVSGYIKVKEARTKGFKPVSARDPSATLERSRTLHLLDDEETEVEIADTAEGHRYGSTLVPVAAEDKEAMKFRAQKCLKVLGFSPANTVPQHIFMGDYSMMFVAEKGDDAAAVALSALISALYETNMVAIVRRVYSAATTPKLGCLAPHIKTGYECLVYHELPFSDDVRSYAFPSLPVVDNPTTETQKKQHDKIDELITAMDLSQANRSADPPSEVLKPKLTFNPHLQRLYQCLQHRKIYPHQPLPELSPVVAGYLEPPADMVESAQPTLDAVQTLFRLTDVSKKKEQHTGESIFKTSNDGAPPAKKARYDDGNLSHMADLSRSKVTEVGSATPVDDFLALVDGADGGAREATCAALRAQVWHLVTSSFGAQFYVKALACVRCLREHAIHERVAPMFNTFLGELKAGLPAKTRQDFWMFIVNAGVSLVGVAECEGGASEAELAAFTGSGQPQEDAVAEIDEDELLDMLE